MTSSLKMIFQGNVSRDEVGSVIMIGDMAGQAAQAGLVPFLVLMALISVNLAYINILPIPGLDGGHIALILIEVLMGRKLSVKARIRIQSFGMFILLTLMVFLISFAFLYASTKLSQITVTCPIFLLGLVIFFP